MTAAEFAQLLKDKKITLNAAISQNSALSMSAKVRWASDSWREVKRDICPHLYGYMPHSIEEAFPNETERQKDYRRTSFTSPTKGYLEKAIADTNRVVMSPQFIISYGDEVAKYFAENPAPFDGVNSFLPLREYLTTVFYQERVKDPNAYFVCLPTNRPELVQNSAGEWVSNPAQAGKKMGVKIMIYPSESIIYIENDLYIFAEPQIPEYPENSIALTVPVYYRVVMPQGSFLYNPTGKNTGEQFKEYYFEDRAPKNHLPLGRLGGKMMTKVVATAQYVGVTIAYYVSDFSYAVPVMEDACRLKSQLNTITNQSIFPKTVTRAVPCRAEGCNGGKVVRRDANGLPITNDEGLPITAKCTTCEGKGTLQFGTQDQLVVPEATSLEAGKVTPIDDYVKSLAPDTSAVQEVREQYEKQMEVVRNTLSIVQQKVVGQSADSKEADEQDKYALLHQVAMGMARATTTILQSVVYYTVEPRLWEQELQQIHVTTPTSFKIYSLDALRAMRDANRTLKDLHTRAIETLMLLESESNDAQKIRERELWQAYTRNLSEATMEELDALDANGDIDKKAKLAALFGGREIARILQLDPMADEAKVFSELDKIFATMAKNTELRANQIAAMRNAANEVQTPIIEEQPNAE